MNLGEIKKYLESISEMDNKDFIDAVEKIAPEFLGFGMYRAAWVIGGSLVIKREIWCETRSGGDAIERIMNREQTTSETLTYYPFANLYEYEFYRRAPKNIKRFFSPCLWISPNGKVALYRYEKNVKQNKVKHTRRFHWALVNSLVDKDKTLQEIVRHFTNELISSSNCVISSNEKRVIIIDYAENYIGNCADSKFAITYDFMADCIEEAVIDTINKLNEGSSQETIQSHWY